MNLPLPRFARLGLVHHMLHARSLEDPDEHAATLEALLRRSDIETLDCCLPYGRERQERLVRAIRASGKEHITFAVHLFPYKKFTPAATSPTEQAQVRLIMNDFVNQAAAMGATGFIFAAGSPPASEATAAHHRAFADFCRWLCERLAPHGIDALLEPFDFDFDKRFLHGPLDRTLELVAEVTADFPNFGLELDMAHLPLMREPFVSAIERTAPWLKRVHLGNCVMRDKADPFYGDRHPPMGYPGGEIDVPQLQEILTTLLDVGFLQSANRGDLVIEMNPFPGRSVDDSVRDNVDRVETAWARVIPKRTLAPDNDGAAS
jgi:sugar phosphate isomerase/epimerase